MRRTCCQISSRSVAWKGSIRAMPVSYRDRALLHGLSSGSGCKVFDPNYSHRHSPFTQGNRCFSSITQTVEPAASDNVADENKNSLHSNIHYLLKRVPTGRMNDMNLQKARSFLFIVSEWNNKQGAQLTEALLERLYKEQTSKATVDTKLYNASMKAWNKSNVDGKTIVYNVESIFARMEERYRDQTNQHALMARPDRTSYNCLLDSYSKCDEDNSFKVHAILDKMKSFAESDEDYDYVTNIEPDEITYNSMMNYYASRSNEHYAAQQAEDILLEMSELAQQSDSNIQITSTSFNIAIKAWSNAGLGLDGAQRAKSLLLMMMKWHNQGYPNVEPTAVSFSTVIDSFAKVSHKDSSVAIENAMELLDEMEASSISDADHINSCYNALANLYIKMEVENAGEKVKMLMLRMKNMDAAPDERMYISCFEAFLQNGIEHGYHSANEALDEMTKSLGYTPSSVAFNVLLSSLVKKNTPQSIEFAQEVLNRMKMLKGNSRPDTVSYSIIIGALSRCLSPESEQKAVNHLRDMLRSYNTDHYAKAKPDSFVFNCTINMLARSNEQWADDTMYKTLMSMENQSRQGNTSVIADTITYNTVIAKLSKNPTKENAKKVMKLLVQMENNEKASNNNATPDIITYTNVLKMQGELDSNRAASIASAYLKRALTRNTLPPIDGIGLRTLFVALSKRGSYEDASIALRTWERFENDAKSSHMLDSDMCNLVLLSYSRVKTDQSASVVFEFILNKFRTYQDGSRTTILPSVVGLSAVMSLLTNRARSNDALSILRIMTAFSSSGHKQMKPDVGCYISILSSMCGYEPSTKNNALFARKILYDMKRNRSDSLPISVINTAINACAWTSGDLDDKMRALQIAFDIFGETKQSQSYDTSTFALMIRACSKLSRDDDVKFKLVKVRVTVYYYL